MLYCPKCNASYSDGTQRFCTNEGARLLPESTPESTVTPDEKGVFTSILNKSLPKADETVFNQSKSAEEETSASFEPPVKSKFFKTEEVEVGRGDETKSAQAEEDILETWEKERFEPLPIARIINPSTIPEINYGGRTSTKKIGQKISTPGLIVKDHVEKDLGDFLEVSGEQESELSGTDLPMRNFDIDPNDLLDTGELFESEPEFIAAESGNQDILALPGLDLDLGDTQDRLPSASDADELELDLESNDEVNLAASIPRIELELAGIEKVSIPSADVFKFEPIEPDDILFEVTEDSYKDRTVDSAADETAEASEKAAAAAAAASVIVQPIDVTADTIKATDDTSWERRSSENSDPEESRWFLYPLVGIAILGLGLLSFFYLTGKEDLPVAAPTNSENAIASLPNLNSNSTPAANEEIIPPPIISGDFPSEPHSALLDISPPPRTVNQPPNTRLYKNEKKSQKGVLAEKFLGFSIYYPKDWSQSRSDNKFLDITKKAPDGLPIKQLLISRYDSRGTFEADLGLFEELVKNSNSDLRKILANYQVISEGEEKFQDGRWRTYEVKFQGIGSDKKLIIWGRRLWIPVQRPGMTSGFIITMIGTSLSKDVKSVEDLGVNDDLAEILKTFEPDLR